MAANGSKSITVTSWDTLKFSWAVSGQSVANNTSTVTWKLELISGSDGRIDSNASKSWSVTVNGNTFKGTNQIAVANNSTVTLAEGTVANGKAVTISHNSDGAKTFSYSFSQQFDITFSGSHIGTKSGTGSGTLNVIARRSSISASNGTLGTSMKLTISKQDSDFTHTIIYKCGTAEGTIVTKTTSTSVSWTPPLSLANQNTTGASVTVTFTITTYTGSTSLGNNSKTISCAIPTSVKPSLTLAVADVYPYRETYGAYVQGKSKLSIAVNASGSYGSTIKSYKTTIDGKTYTSAKITTAVLSSAGTKTISTTITDSRGRTASTTWDVSVLAYASPQITSLTTKRCNADGSTNATGAYIKVTFSGAITSLNSKNTAAYTLQYKKASATSYTSKTLTDYAGKYAVTGGSYIFAADSTAYNIILTCADAFSSNSKTATGSSASMLMSWLRKGLGMALGKAAELSGFFDCGYDAVFRKSIYMDHYGDTEKNIYFANNAYRLGQTFAEDGVYPHRCKVYGGNASSTSAIGLYDAMNARHVIVYNDVDNYWHSGSVFRPQLMEAYPTAAKTISAASTGEKVTLGSAKTNLCGDYLSLSNGGIKCSRKGYVMASASLYLNELTAGDTTAIMILRNDDTMAYVYEKKDATVAYHSIPPVTIAVNAGDIIYLFARNNSGARGTTNTTAQTSRLLVQYIG
jgi:hypothetical protein